MLANYRNPDDHNSATGRLLQTLLAAAVSSRLSRDMMFGRGVVTAIAGIGNDALEHIADQRLHIGNDFRERVPVVRVAAQGHDVG